MTTRPPAQLAEIHQELDCEPAANNVSKRRASVDQSNGIMGEPSTIVAAGAASVVGRLDRRRISLIELKQSL